LGANFISNPTTPLTDPEFLFDFDKKYLEDESLLQGTGGAVEMCNTELREREDYYGSLLSF